MHSARAAHRFLSALSITAIGIAVAACSALDRKNIAETPFEAGSVKVSVISVAPWEDVYTQLLPKFELKGDGALEKILPQSANFRQRQLEAFALGARVGSTGEGDIVGALPTTPEAFGTEAELSNEPIIEYKAATTLFQEVQLLNDYLNHAVIPKGYRPYLVRLQLAVLPLRRNQPFDVFTDLNFLTEGLYEKDLFPKVVPLVVTDSLESARENELAQIVRDISLLASGTSGGTPFAAQLRNISNRLEESQNIDLNSLFTISQVTDNAVRVRLGARYDGGESYEMTARTHNVTLLVNVPPNSPKRAEQETRLNKRLEEFTEEYTKLKPFFESLSNAGPLSQQEGAFNDKSKDILLSAIKTLQDQREKSERETSKPVRKLNLLTWSSMRDARNGNLLEEDTSTGKELNNRLERLSQEYKITDRSDEEFGSHNEYLWTDGEYCVGEDDDEGNRVDLKSTEDVLRKLLYRYVFYDDYYEYANAVYCMTNNRDGESEDWKKKAIAPRDEQALWSELSTLAGSIPRDHITFELPKSDEDPYAFDPIGKVFITSDKARDTSGKTKCCSGTDTPGICSDGEGIEVGLANGVMTDDQKATTVRLAIAQHVDAERFNLALQTGDYEFPAESISVAGTLLTARFPSLQALDKTPGRAELNEAVLKASIKPNPWDDDNPKRLINDDRCRTAYIDVYLLKEKKPEKPTYEITLGKPDTCLTPQVGPLNVRLHLSWKDKKERDIALELNNAAFAIDTPPPPAGWEISPTKPSQAFAKKIKPGYVTFQLEHLKPGEDIVFKFGPEKKGVLDTSEVQAAEKKICVQELPATAKTPAKQKPADNG